MRLSKMLFGGTLPEVGYMKGPGSRGEQNNKPMQGMTLKSLKHHIALQPLFVIMGFGVVMVAAYVARLAIKTTDVNWTKKDEPYDAYRTKQFKFLNPKGIDYEKQGKEIPVYK